jgi:hypothetical protein
MSKFERIVFLATILVGLVLMFGLAALSTQNQLANHDAVIPVTGAHAQANSVNLCCVKGHGWMRPTLQLAARRPNGSLWTWLTR